MSFLFRYYCIKNDKDYYKPEDLNEFFEWLTYDYHKVPNNGCIEVDQGVFTAVADNEDNLNIVIRPKSECPVIS